MSENPAESVEPEDRPRPAYGEYATPEEQRARIQQPGGAPTEQPPAVEKSLSLFSAKPSDAAVAQSAATLAGDGVAPKSRLGDRIATSALLGYGFINVIFTLPDLFSISNLMNRTYEQLAAQGLISEAPTFAGSELATTLGWVLAMVWAGLWVASFAWSLQRMRAGKLAFWIPLAAGVAANLLLAAVAMGLLMSDPSFLEVINEVSTATP